MTFCFARGVAAAFSVVGGYFVFRWSRDLFGEYGALLSLSLWIIDPNILAHAGLVTPDIGATVLSFIATYYFWRYLQSPSLRTALVSGALLGLTWLGSEIDPDNNER